MTISKKQLIRSGLVIAMGLILSISFSLTLSGKNKKNPWKKWDYSREKPVRGGYYRTASGQDVGLMNPNHWPVNDWGIIAVIFEKLVATRGDYREVPWLIKSYSFKNPLTCTFKLRKGITFTDGTPLNAATVKYQMEWILDKRNGCWSRGWLEPLKSTEVIDEYTVRFNFKKPWGSFLGIIASVPGYMMSPKALKVDLALKEIKKVSSSLRTSRKKLARYERKGKTKKAGKEKKKIAKLEKEISALEAMSKGQKRTDVNPVGTSRFMLEDRSAGNWTKLKRNPNWWFGKTVGHPDMPYFDGRLIKVIPDPSVQLANFRSGKIDILFLDKSHYASMKNDRRFKIYVSNLNWNIGLRFNHARKPFSDIRMRKAVSHAINRKALINGLEFGMARIASSFFPDDHWAHNPGLKPVKYDPELSKKLIARAGYPKGVTIKGHMYNDTGSISRTEAIKSMLKKVGINWDVENLNPAAIDDRVKNLEYDLASNIYYYMYEPDLCVTSFYHPDGGWNHGRSNNKKVIKLIENGRKTINYKKRQKIYWKIEDALNKNYEDVYIWWPQVITIFSGNVRGFVYEGGILEHREVWNESHPLWFKDGKP